MANKFKPDPEKNQNQEKQSTEDQRLNISEALKKVLAAGVSAAFMTEESLRSYLAEIKLPKELLGILINQANKSKDDIVNRAGKEISQILSKIDVVKEVSRFAENHKFKITAEIEVIKKDKSSEKEFDK